MSEITKPEMKHGEIVATIDAKVKVELDSDMDRFRNGFLHMSVAFVAVKRDGKAIGDVTMNIQGTAVHMHVADGADGGRTWSIGIEELIPLFLEADKRYREGQ